MVYVSSHRTDFALPRLGLRLQLLVMLLAGATLHVSAGATGEEALGSEERPVVWALVGYDTAPAAFVEDSSEDEPEGADVGTLGSESLEEALVPLEIETGYSMDVAVVGSYSEMISLLESERVHVAIMPPFTFLIALESGLVQTGLIAVSEAPPRGTTVVAEAGLSVASTEDLLPARVARYDRLSQTGWLSAIAALEASRRGASNKVEPVEVTSHDAAINAVRAGRADLAVVPSSHVRDAEDDLVTIAEIEGTAGWGVHFLPTLPPPIVQAISELIRSGEREGAAPGFLADLYGWTDVRQPGEHFVASYRLLLSSLGLRLSQLTQ